MNIKNKTLIGLSGVILASFLAIPALAQSSIAEDQSFVESAKVKIRNGANLLIKLESSLKDQQEVLKDTDTSMEQARKGLRDASRKMQTLKNQLQNVQEYISQSNQKILSARKQIAERETELEMLYGRLKKIKEERNKAKLLHASILQSYEASDSPGLSFFMSESDLSGLFQKKYFLSLAEKASVENLEDLDSKYEALAGKGSDLLEKREKLLELRERLEREKHNLLFYQESKQRLLELTKGDEEKYRSLLEQSKQEQEDVFKVIERLKENYEFVAQKLNVLKNNPEVSSAFSEEDYERALREAPQGLASELRWPVAPVRGISAYFHDEGYRKSMGIPHNAIDIRIPQESVVRAAKTGVVYKTVAPGDGYSYIIIAHENDLLTLYGHMYDIFVSEGDTVFSGQQIGLSGGMPGTRGSGWLTTGPHLHFEVFKNWKQVDPLEYLPLEYLPIEYVPEKYSNLLDGEREKIPNVKKLPKVKE